MKSLKFEIVHEFAAEMVLGKLLLGWSKMSLMGHGLCEMVQIWHCCAGTGVNSMHTDV